jgi:hypothetical protein
MENRQEALVSHFYEWELRGRGWLLFDEAIQLEAPFYPFFGHYTSMPYIDDGARSTFLSTIADLFRKPHVVPDIPAPVLPPIEPFLLEPDTLRVFGIGIPHGVNVTPARMEQLLTTLIQCTGQLSLEIIANHEAITLQCACSSLDYPLIRAQVQAHIPEAIIREEDMLAINDTSFYTADYGLSEEFMRPLAMAGQDWYVALFALCELLQQGEQIAMQMLIAGTVNNWAESIMRAVTINGKESFFADAPEMPTLAQEKITAPLVAATLRVYTQAHSLARAQTLLQQLHTILVSGTASKHNQLLALSDAGYDAETRIDDIELRQSRRLGMLLNVREVATIFHVPSPAVHSTKWQINRGTTKAAPQLSGTYCIGINEHTGIETPVYIPNIHRLEHTHIIGATGTGKSTLLHSLIIQDIAQGNGIAVLDPHGDLIEHILPYIPEHRVKDVVLIDPADAAYPIAFNILHAHTAVEKELLASDLVALFRRFATSWGDQMNSVLANAILAFLESTKGGTLIDLRRFLLEKSFREQFLSSVQDDAITYYWHHEYPLLKSGSIGSILTRLDTFLRPKLIRNMVSQRESLDFGLLMDTNKIILVKLSRGLIGEENSYILGACIVAKLEQAALSRQIQASHTRTPFFLYIDEFHHFLTPSLASALSGVRKYALGLILAHQSMEQLAKHDTELGSALIANAGTRICFRLGERDAKHFAEGFATFSAHDLTTLSKGEAIVRIGGADQDCNIRVLPTEEGAYNLQEQIIAASRERYAAMILPEEPVTPLSQPVQPPPPPPQPKQTIAEEPLKENLIARAEQKQHRYLQNLVKKIAEEHGYRATLEHPLESGRRVDVSLERDKERIAVELSVSTTAVWELHNIKKCLAAWYDKVIACSNSASMLQQLRARVQEECTPAEQARIVITAPTNIAEYLSPPPAAPPTEQTIKGYRVSVSYADVSEAERKQKQELIQKIVRGAKGKNTDEKG